VKRSGFSWLRIGSGGGSSGHGNAYPLFKEDNVLHMTEVFVAVLELYVPTFQGYTLPTFSGYIYHYNPATRSYNPED
jgi:hypothetical protein